MATEMSLGPPAEALGEGGVEIVAGGEGDGLVAVGEGLADGEGGGADGAGGAEDGEFLHKGYFRRSWLAEGSVVE